MIAASLRPYTAAQYGAAASAVGLRVVFAALLLYAALGSDEPHGGTWEAPKPRAAAAAAGHGPIGRQHGGRRVLHAVPTQQAAPSPGTALPLDPFGRFPSKQEAIAAMAQVLDIPVRSGGVQAAYYNVPDKALRPFWVAWKVRFKKDKWYKERLMAEAVAYRYFATNVRRVARSMADVTKPTWYMFGSRMDKAPGPPNGGALPPGDYDGIDAEPPKPSAVKVWDWRRLGKVTTPKDQGDCAGCWAYAAVGAIESKVLISTKTTFSRNPIDLSEQQVLDCANGAMGFDSRGCLGGYLFDPFIYASRGLGFITTERLYPTTGTSGPCDAARLQSIDGASKFELAEGSYELIRPWSAAGLREAVLVQPVVASIYAPDGFQFYSGGVWTAKECEYPAGLPVASRAKINHAVLVVGFNMTASPPYWIVKNSWGSGISWGDDGFGLIEMTGLDGKNSWGTCFMYTWMLRPAEVMPRQGDVVPPAPQTKTLRLMPGNSLQQYGRLEVLVNGVWGTVCNRGFDSVDATIACRQLKLGTSGIALDGVPYGPGTGLPIHWNNLECTGEEAALQQCPFQSGLAGLSGCTHLEDASIQCGDALPEVTVRLVNSEGELRAGRLEVFHNGVWGTVCDDLFSDASAGVVCSQLGLGGAGSAIQRAPYGPGNGTIWLSRVACSGREFKLEACPSAGWGSSTGCTHAEDVGVRCYGQTGEADVLPGVVTARLVGGSTRRQGRLEVLQKGVWRTVCDDGADAALAKVLCRQLGLAPIGAARNRTVGGSYYGQGTGVSPLYLHCSGREDSWEECSAGAPGTRSCTHAEDVGVVCGVALDVMVRLADGPDSRSGRLEVRPYGLSSQWGTVCNRNQSFDALDARVVCKSLGLGSYAVVSTSGTGYGTSGGPVWMSDVACGGAETTLLECQWRPADSDCSHAWDVGIRCSDSPPGPITLRLVNGANSTSGRLEVLQRGVWGTVCQAFTSAAMATVACRQLGFGSEGILKTNAKPFGEGTGPIHLAALDCNGTESRIDDCPRIFEDTSTCRHYEDVGVICYDPPQPLYKFSGKWGSAGAAAGQLESPMGLVATRGGDLFVCDTANHRIQRFSPSGEHLASFGSQGDGPGQLSFPSAIIQIDTLPDLLIADTGNRRIERYTLEGQRVGGWTAGPLNGGYKMGLLVRNGVVYFADAAANRIQAFDVVDGNFLRQWGITGVAPGQLFGPCALLMDPAGQTLYVLECGTRRVARYNPTTGQYLSSFGGAQLYSPRDMCLSEEGEIVVGDQDSIVVFNLNGTFLGAVGKKGPADGEFAIVGGIACSTDGSSAVFVSDTSRKNIQRFAKLARAAAAAAGTTGPAAQAQTRSGPAAAAAALLPGSGADPLQTLSGQTASTAATAAATSAADGAAGEQPGGSDSVGQEAAAAASAAAAAGSAGASAAASLARMQSSLVRFAADVARLVPQAGGQQAEPEVRLAERLAERLAGLADAVDVLVAEFWEALPLPLPLPPLEQQQPGGS